MKAFLFISLFLVIGCVSNTNSGRGLASEDEATGYEPSELEQRHAFRYGTVSNPDWHVNTYIPEGSQFQVDPSLVDKQKCEVSITKKNDDGRFWMDINVGCQHAIQSSGDFEIERCGFLSGYGGGTGIYRAADIQRDPSLPGRMYYAAEYGGLVMGPTQVYNRPNLFQRMIIEIDPLTDEPTRMSIEYRYGPQPEFRQRALQALFTCEVNQTTANL